jgi:hypothetical protein
LDWSHSLIASFSHSECGGGSAHYFVDQPLSNGNPDAYRWTRLQFDGASIYVGHLNMHATYDPSTNGPIASISYSYDVRNICCSFLLPAYGLLIYQNGSYYMTGTGVVPMGGWIHVEETVAASGFSRIAGSGPTLPNFSSTGAPMQFGFRNSSGPRFCDSATIDTGIDNWRMVIDGNCVTSIQEATWSALKNRYSSDP